MEDWNETERNVVAEEVEDSGEGEVQQVAHQEQEDVPEEERVTIRLKFLNETQKEVEASLVENLGQFKRRNFTEEIGNNKNVRLIFNGQVIFSILSVILKLMQRRPRQIALLPSSHRIRFLETKVVHCEAVACSTSEPSCGKNINLNLTLRCVVHCLVSNLPSSNGTGTTQQASTRSGVHDHLLHHNQGAAHGHHHQIHHGQALDVSAFFIPLLGLALAMVWYLAIAYNSYFNFMSTTALLGLTSLYFLSVYGTHFHVNVAVRTAVPPEARQ